MESREVVVVNRSGLHGRASARLVQEASRFSSRVSLVVRGRRASARSVLAVMLLSASMGSQVRLEADGPDEAAAVRELSALFQSGFGEGA